MTRETIRIDEGATVQHLELKNVVVENMLDVPVAKFVNNGAVGELYLENTTTDEKDKMGKIEKYI